MIIANGKEVVLEFKTRLLVYFEERFKVENMLDFWKQAMVNDNLQVLSVALVTFSNKALKDVNEAYDFIDDYLAEGDNTVNTLYMELIKEINDKGFFKGKMTAEELQMELSTPILNMEEIMQRVMVESAKGMTLGQGS